MTVSMLRSLGIPVETVIGKVSWTETTDNHEYVRAQVGSGWGYMDSTWESPGNPRMKASYMIARSADHGFRSHHEFIQGV